MTGSLPKGILYGAILVAGFVAPILFPGYTFSIAGLWVMILLALTWDIMGGQMGYNSLGNVFFFGIGMYTCMIVQVGLFYDVAEYTAHSGAVNVHFAPGQYFTGLTLGLAAAAAVATLFALVFGQLILGLRGPYFAIGTLGVALSAGELFGAWPFVGGGGGVALPTYPGEPDDRAYFFYVLCMLLAVAAFAFLKWLYSTRFKLVANAIRDDEEKAEAMGLHTKRYKNLGFAITAFFLGISGGLYGNMIGFIEPLEVAYPVVTFGIFMIVMCLIGGKGTLWGPVIGATLFHVVRQLTWTYMLGWQWVALGGLIIVSVVFFQQGIVGWMQEKWPEWFGIRVDEKSSMDDGFEAGTAKKEAA
ncbi:MAG: branched-chain amino acid ABC transporter permease [Alphaproteobacteria bacterium]|nr:branched-chain amino acid ABC transporter permease [Alphaproteobacteria bacterium]